MSYDRIAKVGKLVRGPTGRYLCRCGCNREVLPPRRTFFSEECVHSYKIKRDPGYVRILVEARDKGVCAACGVDTNAVKLRFKEKYAPLPHTARCQSFKELAILGWPLTFSRSWWEADHIVPVVEGGGGCGLENYRTLCCPCHKKVTRELRARLAREKPTN